MIGTAIEINPNLRLNGDQTIADFDDIRGQVPAVNGEVVVFEAVSGLTGRGWVIDVDPHQRTVTLKVDWASLRVMPTRPNPAVFTDVSVTGPLLVQVS